MRVCANQRLTPSASDCNSCELKAASPLFKTLSLSRALFLSPVMAGKFGRTQVHCAARTGGLTPQLLASDHGSIDARDDHGFTPLYHASMFGDIGGIETLLGAGAALQLADLGGLTPLHIACEKGHADAVRCLLQHGANAQATDKIGRTPADWAREKGHADVLVAMENCECLKAGDVGVETPVIY